jgi:hypothetical protein
MSCIADVRKTILDDIFKEFVSTTHTFKRVGLDKIEVTQQVKNKSSEKATAQAEEALRSVLKRIAIEYEGHVKGEIHRPYSIYDGPISATIIINPNYLNHVFQTQVQAQDRLVQGELFSIGTVNQTDAEQNNVNANEINSEEDFANPIIGTLEGYIQKKEDILADYEKRLKETIRQIEVINDKEKPTQQDKDSLIKLNKKRRDLSNSIKGVRETGQKGLKQEIIELKNTENSTAIGYYVEKDLARLAKLVESDDLGELEEAVGIIDFYENAGTFVFTSNKDNPQGHWRNPFFSKEDVYITDANGKPTGDFKLTDEDMAVFKKWSNTATVHRITIDNKRAAALEQIVNTDSAKINTFGAKEFTKDELVDGSNLKDTHWVDMYTMDITKNIVNKDSILPQIVFNQLQDSIFDRQSEALKFAKRVDEKSPGVIKRLLEIGKTLKAAGIEGLNHGSFSLFLEKTRDGLLTGGYVYKYSRDFINDKTSIDKQFKYDWYQAIAIQDSTQRNKAIKKAFKDKRDWYRQNTGIIHFHKLGEIASDPEFSSWSSFFEVDDNYKQKLIDIIGQKEYDKQVINQKKLLREYSNAKQDMIDTLMETQGITDYSLFSESNKRALDSWTIQNSPFYGINNHYEVNFNAGKTAGNFQEFNVFVPRRNETKVQIDPNDNTRVVILETNKKTAKNYYNEDYEKFIENDNTLYEFHQLLEESMNYVKKNAPPDIAEKMAVNYLSALKKTSAEIVTTSYENHSILQRIIPAFAKLWENIRLGFGVKQQSELNYTTKDGVTGQKNYKVNDAFLRDNQKAIKDRITIEEARFLKALGTTSPLNRLRGLKYSDLNEHTIILLGNYLGLQISPIDAKNLNTSQLEARLGKGEVKVAQAIKEYATHEAVKENSFDLPKLIKHFTYQSAYYSAKTEALPRLTLLKNYYESIEKVETNNLSKPIFNTKSGKNDVSGVRDHAIKRFDEHWERVVLGNTGRKHKGEFSLGKEDGLIGKTIYSKEDRKKLNEINEILGDSPETKEQSRDKINALVELLKDETIPNKDAVKQELSIATKRAELIAIRDSLGKTRTVTAFIDSFLNWVRYQKLGWNVNSGVTNAFEGYISNMIIAANGEYFTPNNIYLAYGLIKHSSLKNMSFGKAETGVAKKIRVLMDRFDVLVDVANELQKSSAKTFESKAEWLKAMTITRRIEYVNQGVMMLATLLDQKVTSTITGKTVNVFEAMDNNGKLMPEYATEENIEAWENARGNTFLTYKKNLSNTIELGHGNYDVLKGMLAKSTTAGKFLMMFKTWLPMQLYWRFATRQVDMQSGSVDFKGKYWSYGIGSGALHGATVGLGFAGPFGAVIGAMVGIGFGAYNNHKNGRTEDITGVLKETLTSTMMLLKKMVGMPVNSLLGRSVIETNKGVKIGNTTFDFDSRVGKKGFTANDAKALNSNMTDIAMQLTFLALLVLVKATLWDDDDEADSTERQWHNLLVNKIMQLASQGGSYVNITSKEGVLHTTVGSVAAFAYMLDVGKVLVAVDKFFGGEDTIKTGVTAGESRLGNQLIKTVVPGMFKSPLSLGFDKQMERQFQASPLDRYFKLNISDKRREMKEELKEEGLSNSEINKELNSKLPTKERLKKAGKTRKEWLEEQQIDN